MNAKKMARSEIERWRRLLIKYLIRGELAYDTATGELRFNGMCYVIGLDRDGCPLFNSYVLSLLCANEDEEYYAAQEAKKLLI